MIDDLFDSAGAFDGSLIEFRIEDSTRKLQTRAGTFANATVGWVDLGDNPYTFVQKGAWAASTAYNQTDIVTHGTSTYMAVNDHTSSGSAPSGTDFKIMIDGAALTTSQNAAAASATAASTSESNALTYKTAAETAKTAAETAKTAAETAKTASETAKTASETAKTGAETAKTGAETAKTGAETAKTAAETAKTGAETAKTAAEAAYDSFDDRYLGVKSADVTVDNDGNALVDGALYFNTTNNVMMVYDLGGTTWNRTTPTTSDQTKINTVSGIASDVTTVAGKATEIGLLGTSAAVADMAILATTDVVADMAILATADIVTDMNTLGTADVVADMNTLGTADVVADMNVLATADVVIDMNTLGTADVVTDMNTLGTADVVTDMNTLGTATNVTNMATCAANITGVNSFADRYRVGSADPTTSLTDGDLFYNTTSDAVKVYNGSAWVTSAGFASFDLPTMTDVTVTSVADNDILAYDSGTSKWINQSPTEASIDVGDLADTTITSVADNEVLAYDNSTSTWINQTAAEAGLATSGHNHTGTYEPASAAIQTHIGNADKHREIDDAATGTTDLWSASKINTVTSGNTTSISTNTTAIAAIADPVVMAIALG